MTGCLFGSDYPFFDMGDALTALDALGFTPSEQRQIAHDNAAELFDLEGSEADGA